MKSEDCKGVFDEYGKYSHDKTRLKLNDYRIMVVKELGSKCVRCGEKEFHQLEVDHVKNDAQNDMKLFKNDKELYKYLINEKFALPGLCIDRDRYQILCGGCNAWKRKENAWLKRNGKSVIEKIHSEL